MMDPFEHLLRQSLHARRASAHPEQVDGAPASDCLDAETLAAWAEGTLRPDEIASAEGHVSSCSRCQAMLATMARTIPAAPSESWWRRGRTLGWLVPLTAGATAVVLWFAIPPSERPGAVEQQKVQTQAAPERRAELARPADQPQTAAPDQQERLRARTDVPPQAQKEAAAKDEAPRAISQEKRDARNEGARTAQESASAEGLGTRREAPKAPAASPAAEPVVGGALASSRVDDGASFQIVSPNPSIRWRISGTSVQFSSNGGVTWETVSTGAIAPLTAGASPSPTVCWLVGRGGTVLLSTDGRRWERKPFPEAVDLNGILATDARTATVTTVDSRIFSTADGGLTWTRP